MKGGVRQTCPTQARSRRWMSIALVALVVLLAFLCSRFWFQLMLIQGESMAPAYHHLQLVVLDKRADAYAPGEVIAFRCDGLDAVLVKRVIAGPGDTAQIDDGTLLINGVISTIYPVKCAFEYAGLLEECVAMGEGEYVVIGDNLAQSKDSRYPEVGIIEAGDIFGRVIAPVRPVGNTVRNRDAG